MTERDLYVSSIPQIAEIAVESRRMDRKEYENWKRETLDSVPESAKAFIQKVFFVIDSLVLKGSAVA